jgi:trans-aconitate methyltransferase
MSIGGGAIMPGSVVRDFGCASGAFLHHLSHEFPGAEYHGYDVVDELLVKARLEVPAATFHKGSVLERSLIQPSSTDVAFLVGSISP